MIPENQQVAVAALAEVWRLSPNVRLGQLMAHLGLLGEMHLDRGLGVIDDDELMSILDRHRIELLNRSQTTPNHIAKLHPTGTVIPAG